MCFGPVGTALLFENDLTRVWEVVLEPGEDLGMHRHEYPYVVIIVEGARCLLIAEDGSETVIDPQPGEIMWKDIPDIHALRNIGTTRFCNRFVEFKHPGASQTHE